MHNWTSWMLGSAFWRMAVRMQQCLQLGNDGTWLLHLMSDAPLNANQIGARRSRGLWCGSGSYVHEASSNGCQGGTPSWADARCDAIFILLCSRLVSNSAQLWGNCNHINFILSLIDVKWRGGTFQTKSLLSRKTPRIKDLKLKNKSKYSVSLSFKF